MRTALLALLLACGDKSGDDTAPTTRGDDTAGADVDPLEWALTEDGPYRIGYQLTETTYTTALGDAHTIPLHVFYPTDAETGEEVRHDTLFIDESALGGAAPAAPAHAGGYPVLVHSHGYFGVAGAVNYWAGRLVSHGWVVVAPGHVGNTFAEGFPNFDLPDPTRQLIERPGDVSAALDFILATDMLAGPVDAETVGLSGHSRGAYTVWAAAGATFDADAIAAACAGETGAFSTGTCTEAEEAAFLSGDLADTRFQASILLDGNIRRNLFGDTGHRTAHTPFLSLSQVRDGERDQFDTVDQLDFTWVSVEGSCHETFNLGVEASTLQPCATFDVDRGWDLTATYSFAFLRHHLQGDTSEGTVSILDGTTVVDEAATFQRKLP